MSNFTRENALSGRIAVEVDGRASELLAVKPFTGVAFEWLETGRTTFDGRLRSLALDDGAVVELFAALRPWLLYATGHAIARVPVSVDGQSPKADLVKVDGGIEIAVEGGPTVLLSWRSVVGFASALHDSRPGAIRTGSRF